MKKFLFGFLIIFLFLSFPGNVSALENRGGFVVEKYETAIEVKRNGDLDIKERMEIDFSEPRHGVFREIPYKYKNDRGLEYNLELDDFQVTDSGGEKIPFEKSRSGGEVVLKIGDSREEVTGKQVYEIKYLAKGGIRFFENHDELYWNAIGGNWPTSINQARARVIFPGNLDIKKEDLNCFTGGFGSKESDCYFEKIKSKDVVAGVAFYSEDSLEANEGMTIAVKFPKGFITEPGWKENLFKLFFDNWGFLTPLPVLMLMFWLWLGKGKEINLARPAIAQYEIPDNLTPGEAGYLMREKYSNQFVAADMVNLAVKGFLKIKEIEKKGLITNIGIWIKRIFILVSLMIPGLMGIVVIVSLFRENNSIVLPGAIFLVVSGVVGFSYYKKSKLGYPGDYELIKLKDYKDDENLIQHEENILDGLFDEGKREKVKISQLKNFHSDVEKAKKSIRKRIEDRGYFYVGVFHKKGLYFVFGGALAIIGFFTGRIDFMVGLALSAIVVIVFGLFMSKKTKTGAEAFWKTKGFKNYIKTAERYGVRFQERENLFEKYLPYAMVFGMADKWAKAFEGIYEKKPEWYESNQNKVFYAGYLASSLDNNFSSAAKAVSNPPRSSSSSGFGGGGSSGGGFGGGGGGSW